MTGRIALMISVLILLLSPASVGGQVGIPASDDNRHSALFTQQADNGIVVVDGDVDIYFPDQAVFTIEAESSADIVDVRLYYQVDKMSYAEVVSESRADFTPATSVKASWTWDMRQASLPPGAEVTYWWVIEDADGSKLHTSPRVMHFDDDRFSWQSSTTVTPHGGELTVFWYEGGESFIKEVMDTCEEGLGRLTEDIGVYPERSIKIYLYASASDLRGAMIFPQEWTGGVAFTEFSTIAIGISPGTLDWGKRALVHELTHLVVHQLTFSPYGQLPRWLDEGLATYNEGELDYQLQTLLEKAVLEDNLISVRSLCSPFSVEPEKAYLSYAQSYSLVEYLLENYGRDSMLDLLVLLREGATYDEALSEVYGFNIDGLDARWRETLTESTGPTPRAGLHPALTALLAVLVAALVVWGTVALRRRTYRRSS